MDYFVQNKIFTKHKTAIIILSCQVIASCNVSSRYLLWAG